MLFMSMLLGLAISGTASGPIRRGRAGQAEPSSAPIFQQQQQQQLAEKQQHQLPWHLQALLTFHRMLSPSPPVPPFRAERGFRIPQSKASHWKTLKVSSHEQERTELRTEVREAGLAPKSDYWNDNCCCSICELNKLCSDSL